MTASAVTSTHVLVFGDDSDMAKNRGGKPPNFTPEQSKELRKLAKTYLDRNKLTQRELGERIGVEQQSISVFVEKDGTITYVNATKLVALGGWEGVDQFFRERQVALQTEAKIPNMPDLKDAAANDSRSWAMRIARQRFITEQAIREVNAELGEVKLEARTWVDRYHDRQKRLDATRETASKKR